MMRIDIIKNNIAIIEDARQKLALLKKEFPKLELRVFNDNGWNKIDYKSDNPAIRNYIIHQLTMELENSIKKSEKLIKKATES